MPHSETYLSIIDLETHDIISLTNDITGGHLNFTLNGYRILILRSSGLYIINSDGSNLTRISDSLNVYDFYYNISPTDNLIIFSDSEDILTFDYLDHSIINLTEDFELPSLFPSFSPDGQRIVFSTQHFDDENQSIVSLIVMSADGTDKQIIYTDSTTYLNRIDYPVFSSNMEKIIFTNGSLRICDIDGTNYEIIENTGSIFNPVSEANNIVVFEMSNEIYSYHLLNDEIQYLTYGTYPKILYDGSRIAYVNDELRIINSNGSDDYFLAETRSPSFEISSNSEEIIFFGEE